MPITIQHGNVGRYTKMMYRLGRVERADAEELRQRKLQDQQAKEEREWGRWQQKQAAEQEAWRGQEATRQGGRRELAQYGTDVGFAMEAYRQRGREGAQGRARGYALQDQKAKRDKETAEANAELAIFSSTGLLEAIDIADPMMGRLTRQVLQTVQQGKVKPSDAARFLRGKMTQFNTMSKVQAQRAKAGEATEAKGKKLKLTTTNTNLKADVKRTQGNISLLQKLTAEATKVKQARKQIATARKKYESGIDKEMTESTARDKNQAALEKAQDAEATSLAAIGAGMVALGLDGQNPKAVEAFIAAPLVHIAQAQQQLQQQEGALAENVTQQGEAELGIEAAQDPTLGPPTDWAAQREAQGAQWAEADAQAPAQPVPVEPMMGPSEPQMGPEQPPAAEPEMAGVPDPSTGSEEQIAAFVGRDTTADLARKMTLRIGEAETRRWIAQYLLRKSPSEGIRREAYKRMLGMAAMGMIPPLRKGQLDPEDEEQFVIFMQAIGLLRPASAD